MSSRERAMASFLLAQLTANPPHAFVQALSSMLPDPAETDAADELRRKVTALESRLKQCDEDDSRKLRELREAVEDGFGWDSEEAEEASDYVARVREVAVAIESAKTHKRDLEYAQADVKQAREERDAARDVLAAADSLGHLQQGSADFEEGLKRLARAVHDYDAAGIPF